MVDHQRQAAERAARRARAESREMREEVEAIEAEVAGASRTFGDALIDLGRRGAAVRIETAVDVVSGDIVHVGFDVVAIIAPTGARIDVALSAVVGVHSDVAGARPRSVTNGHPQTLLARLRELEGPVELQRSSHSPILGRLLSVASDHCCVAVGLDHSRTAAPVEVIVPMANIVWIRTQVNPGRV